jgi:hypothetical protein
LRETGGDRKPGLSPTDDEHGGIAVGIFRRGFPQVELVGPAEVTRIDLALRA